MPAIPGGGGGASLSGRQLSDLRTGVYDRLGVPTTDPKFPAAKINRFLNAALRQIATKRDWPWLQASVTFAASQGVDGYNVPADWTGTTAVVLTRSDGTTIPLTAWARAQLDDSGAAAADQGEPTRFAVFAEQIILRAVPDQAYSLSHRYTRAEVTLSVDTDRPYLPDGYCDPLCDLATYLALGSSKEDNRAVAAHGRYAEWLGDMVDNDRRVKRPGRVQARPGML